jgi:hypothetical protein
MTATDNPKILSSTAIATTAMIVPTDRGARADTDRPLRAPDPPNTMPVALSHISETATRVCSHKLNGPKSP